MPTLMFLTFEIRVLHLEIKKKTRMNFLHLGFMSSHLKGQLMSAGWVSVITAAVAGDLLIGIFTARTELK